MKIGIMSDLHLGERRFRKQKNGTNAFKLRNYECLHEALDVLLHQNVDEILVAGDLFDSHAPEVDAILQAKQLGVLNIPVRVISGNHDFSLHACNRGYHCFDILKQPNSMMHLVHQQAENVHLEDGTNLWMVPYGQMRPNLFKQMAQSHVKGKKSVLVVHGYVDAGVSKNALGDEEDPYLLPRAVAERFNLVVCGHVHLPHLVGKPGKCQVLTPGSIMPSAASFDAVAAGADASPSVWVYDTKNDAVDRFKLQNAPQVHAVWSEDVNSTLEHIAERPGDIWWVHWNGSVVDVREALYKKALQNSLHVSLQTVEAALHGDEQLPKVPVFWDWVQKEHADWYDELQMVAKEEA